MLIEILSFVVLAIVGVCCILDFKRTVIAWLPTQMLFNAQVAVRYASPAMSLTLAVDILLLCYYAYKRFSLVKKLYRGEFIFLVPMIGIIISYLLSSTFGVVQSQSGYTTMIKFLICGFGMMFLAHKVLYNKKDIELFIKISTIVCLLMTVLALTESIFKDNLWLDFVYFNSPHDETTEGRMYYTPPILGTEIEMRYGMVRARSFFGIHIAFGFACLCYFWLLTLAGTLKWKVLPRYLHILVLALLLGGIFMANAKTGYVGLLIMSIGLIPINKLLNIKVAVPIMLIIIVIACCFPQYLNNFYSLFDSNLADEGGGSTVANRELQFEAAMNMFEMNPILGNGPGSINIMKRYGSNSNILGAESIWMQILPERGILGMFIYLFMYAWMLIKFSKYLPHKLLFTFLIGMFVMETATGMLDMAIWGVVLIAAKRMYQIKKMKKKYLIKIRQSRNNEQPESISTYPHL